MLLELAAQAECRSTHPIAQSILAAYGKPLDEAALEGYQEVPGHGVSVTAGGRRVLAGMSKATIWASARVSR